MQHATGRMQYNSRRACDNTLAEKKTQAAFGQFQTQRTNPPWTPVFQIAATSAGNPLYFYRFEEANTDSPRACVGSKLGRASQRSVVLRGG